MLDPVTVKAIADGLKTSVVEKAVGTVFDGLKQLMAPISATLAGKARLITARYDRLSEEGRQNVDDTALLAMKRIEGVEIPMIADFDPKVIAAAIEGAAMETDEELRQAWANLIAQELTVGGVHPLFPKVLTQMMPEDAKTLWEIAQQNKRNLGHATRRWITFASEWPKIPP